MILISICQLSFTAHASMHEKALQEASTNTLYATVLKTLFKDGSITLDVAFRKKPLEDFRMSRHIDSQGNEGNIAVRKVCHGNISIYWHETTLTPELRKEFHVVESLLKKDANFTQKKSLKYTIVSCKNGEKKSIAQD